MRKRRFSGDDGRVGDDADVGREGAGRGDDAEDGDATSGEKDATARRRAKACMLSES